MPRNEVGDGIVGAWFISRMAPLCVPSTSGSSRGPPAIQTLIAQIRAPGPPHSGPSPNTADSRSEIRHACAAGKKKAAISRNPLFFGAGDRIRTYDRLITNQLLYRLSYASMI